MPNSIFELNPERAAEAGEVADLRLVETLREGSERAYEELITRFQQPVFALASVVYRSRTTNFAQRLTTCSLTTGRVS